MKLNDEGRHLWGFLFDHCKLTKILYSRLNLIARFTSFNVNLIANNLTASALDRN